MKNRGMKYVKREHKAAFLISIAILLCIVCTSEKCMATEYPKDLNPVTFKRAPTHPPVVLVEDGEPRAMIVVMGKAKSMKIYGGDNPARIWDNAVSTLQQFIRAATDAELPILRSEDGAMPAVEGTAIVIGDCPEAAAAGLVGKVTLRKL